MKYRGQHPPYATESCLNQSGLMAPLTPFHTPIKQFVIACQFTFTRSRCDFLYQVLYIFRFTNLNIKLYSPVPTVPSSVYTAARAFQ